MIVAEEAPRDTKEILEDLNGNVSELVEVLKAVEDANRGISIEIENVGENIFRALDLLATAIRDAR